jgi:hypothetical protein
VRWERGNRGNDVVREEAAFIRMRYERSARNAVRGRLTALAVSNVTIKCPLSR